MQRSGAMQSFLRSRALPKIQLATVLVLFGLLSANCSEHPASAPTAPNAGAVKTPGPETSESGNACERKLLSTGDIDDILREPAVATRPLPGDPQTCYFVAASADRGGPRLMITLRPAGGRAMLASYSSGRLSEHVTAQPLNGVGDEAVWIPALHEVDARKGDRLCIIAPDELSATLRQAGEAAQQQALGGLCNKIFAAF